MPASNSRNARPWGWLSLCGTLLAAATGAAQAQPATTTTVTERPGSGTNRITVTGNQADGSTRCADGTSRARSADGSTNVNSVNINGQSLSGRTIVVTGGNTAPCNTGAGGSTNSVNIR